MTAAWEGVVGQCGEARTEIHSTVELLKNMTF